MAVVGVTEVSSAAMATGLAEHLRSAPHLPVVVASTVAGQLSRTSTSARSSPLSRAWAEVYVLANGPAT